MFGRSWYLIGIQSGHPTVAEYVSGHPTVAEYIEPSASDLSEENVISKDQKCWETHVRSSQYFTQIVKCDIEKCCKKKIRPYFNLIKNRFLPPLFPIAQTSEGLRVPKRSSAGTSHRFPSLFVALNLRVNDMSHRSASVVSSIPYDLYCPSIRKVLSERICKTCGQNRFSCNAAKSHKDAHASTISNQTRAAS